MLTEEMKKDIDMLAAVVTDETAIAKAMQRKYERKVSVIHVRTHLHTQKVLEAERAIARETGVAPVKKFEPASQGETARTMQAQTAMEVGSKMLLAAICRMAFKKGWLLPNLTYHDQLERARADGYSGPIEGALGA